MRIIVKFADSSRAYIDTTAETINADIREYFKFVWPEDKPVSVSIEDNGANMYNFITSYFDIPKYE